MKGLYKGFLANVVRSVGGALVLALVSVKTSAQARIDLCYSPFKEKTLLQRCFTTEPRCTFSSRLKRQELLLPAPLFFCQMRSEVILFPEAC